MRNDETRDTLHRRGTDSRVQNVKSTRSCALRAYPWCAVTRASMGRAAQLPIHVHPAVLGILPMHAAQHITCMRAHSAINNYYHVVSGMCLVPICLTERRSRSSHRFTVITRYESTTGAQWLVLHAGRTKVPRQLFCAPFTMIIFGRLFTEPVCACSLCQRRPICNQIARQDLQASTPARLSAWLSTVRVECDLSDYPIPVGAVILPPPINGRRSQALLQCVQPRKRAGGNLVRGRWAVLLWH